MKKKIIIQVVIVIALQFLIFSCRPQSKEKEKEEFLGASPVKVVKVKRQRISEKLYFTGTIEPWKKINLTPDVGGKIARILVEEGDRVKKGQVVAELDTRAVRLQLEQAEAALAVAEANYKDAKKNMERMEKLIQEKAVSDQQFEKVRLAFEAAEAQRQQAQAALNLARYNLTVSLMKAPFRGVVASKNAEVGDVINPMMGGFSPTSGVLTLMNYERVKIVIDVSHKDIVHIKKGQPALLRVSAFPEKTFEGRVTMVNVTADPLARKFKVEVVVDNPDLVLRPNTFGEVLIEVSSKEDALVIPQKAILEGNYVFVANDNRVEKRNIILGMQNAELVEVIKGLEEGEMVVVEGNYGLEDGVRIDIKEVLK